VVNPDGRLADGEGVLGCTVGRGLDEPGLTETEAVALVVVVGAAALGEAGAGDTPGPGAPPSPVQAASAPTTSITPVITILLARIPVPLSVLWFPLVRRPARLARFHGGNLSAAHVFLVEAKVTATSGEGRFSAGAHLYNAGSAHCPPP
jgi:hypothetical protein